MPVWVAPTGVAKGVLATIGLTAVVFFSYKSTLVLPSTFSADFKAEVSKRGSIPSTERSGAPAVYLNPITNGLPGSVRGPEDLAAE